MKFRRVALIVLVNVNLLLLLVEVGLRMFDPWGLSYFDDLRTFWRVVDYAEHSYSLAPGVYTFTHFTAAVTDNSMRYLPDAHSGNCRLILMGDSVTWGWGVNDKETWANLVASQLPSVTTSVSALPGYDMQELLAIYPRLSADAIVYLAFPNDDNRPRYGKDELKTVSAVGQIGRYLAFFRGEFYGVEVKDRAFFEAGLSRFVADSRFTIVAFDDTWGQELSRHYPVHLIPWYTHRVSRADSHPDAAGNVQIAASMLPIIREAVAAHCAATL